MPATAGPPPPLAPEPAVRICSRPDCAEAATRTHAWCRSCQRESRNRTYREMAVRLRTEGIVPAACRLRQPHHANVNANFANRDDGVGRSVVGGLVAALKKGNATPVASCQACRALVDEVAAVTAQVTALTERTTLAEHAVIELGRALQPRSLDATHAVAVSMEARRLGLLP